MKIYMIRHGQTDWNKTGKLQGQTDIPLNEAGRALAVKAGHALRDVPFTRVISSPLSRAVETAKLVLAAAGRVLPVEKDPRIEEISFGDLEGAVMKGTELSPEAEEFQAFFDAPEKYRPARNGETLEQLLKRTGDFLTDLAASCRSMIRCWYPFTEPVCGLCRPISCTIRFPNSGTAACRPTARCPWLCWKTEPGVL